MKPSFVTYTDSVYFKKLPDKKQIKLYKYEAIGFLSRNKQNDFILEYILDTKPNKNIIEGLVIPKQAILKNQKENNIAEKFKINQKVSLDWYDAVHVVNDSIKEISIMNTEGEIYKKYKKFILIKDPVTTRVYPLPNKKHPEDDCQYYLIPNCLIKNIKLI